MPRRKIIKPTKTGEVITEMGNLFYDARTGTLDTLDASRLASILSALRQAIENQDLEERLVRLEELERKSRQ